MKAKVKPEHARSWKYIVCATCGRVVWSYFVRTIDQDGLAYCLACEEAAAILRDAGLL